MDWKKPSIFMFLHSNTSSIFCTIKTMGKGAQAWMMGVAILIFACRALLLCRVTRPQWAGYEVLPHVLGDSIFTPVMNLSAVCGVLYLKRKACREVARSWSGPQWSLVFLVLSFNSLYCCDYSLLNNTTGLERVWPRKGCGSEFTGSNFSVLAKCSSQYCGVFVQLKVYVPVAYMKAPMHISGGLH